MLQSCRHPRESSLQRPDIVTNTPARKLAITVIFVALLGGCDDCHTEESSAPPDVDTIDEWLDIRAQSLSDIDDLGPVMEMADDRELILLGESTHGTHEYYQWRAEMTLALAEEQGIDFVGIEGDWHTARAADQYVTGQLVAEDARQVVEDAFDRWPRWMWANSEFADFLEEIRAHNEANPEHPVRIYGIDMQGFFGSLNRLVEIVAEDHPGDARRIREYLQCLNRFFPQPGQYAQAIESGATEGCEEEITDAVEAVGQLYDGDGIRDLSARKHARVVASGEEQFRKRVTGGDDYFWNVRAAHMFDAVQGMLAHHGDDARGVIWAHNTHIGDARATDMSDQGRINIGQVSRETLGDEAVLAVGFSTQSGDVIAGNQWRSPHRSVPLPEPPKGTVDEKLSRHDDSAYFVIFDDGDAELDFWAQRPGQRAVGVVYHPAHEEHGNYVPTNPAQRYDALIYLDETTALDPL